MNEKTTSFEETNRHIKEILEEIENPLYEDKFYLKKTKEEITKEKKSSFIDV